METYTDNVIRVVGMKESAIGLREKIWAPVPV